MWSKNSFMMFHGWSPEFGTDQFDGRLGVKDFQMGGGVASTTRQPPNSCQHSHVRGQPSKVFSGLNWVYAFKIG